MRRRRREPGRPQPSAPGPEIVPVPARAPAATIKSRIVLAITIVAILAAIAAAVRVAWVCDDAFISFRYARNLAHGLGLVFNPGERVEGYSNFLWTLGLASALRLGADPVPVSEAVGLLCYAGTLGLLAWASRRTARPAPPGPGAAPGAEEAPAAPARIALAAPLACLALAAHEHARRFATGGLETPLITLLVTAVTVASIEARSARGYALAGTLASLAALTRPDGALTCTIPVLAALPDLGRRRWRPLAASLAPMILVLAPYTAWKISYYGDWLPNTFYAKDAGRTHFAQGFTYLGVYFAMYWILALGLVAPLWRLAAAPRGVAEAGGGSAWIGRRAPALILATALLHLVYVARVGGDFMFARFCLPVTPALLLGTELLTLSLRPAWARWGLVALVVAALLTARVPEPIRDRTNPTGIVEEWTFYPEGRVREAERAGSELRAALEGSGASVAVYGSQAMLAYYGAFPVAIEAATGLTDREIARMPVIPGSRIGHEKAATLPYLQGRGVGFVFSFGLYRLKAHTPINSIRIGDVEGVILSYHPEVMDRIAGRPGVAFTDVRSVLDQEIPRIPRTPPAALREEYAWFKTYYFDHAHDPARQQPFLQALALGPAARP